MKVRFQTDADFDRRIIRATLRREPVIDLQLATAARGGAGLRGVPDAQVLAVAAQEGRMLLSHDYRTMPKYFGDFIAIQGKSRCDHHATADADQCGGGVDHNNLGCE